MFHYSFYFVCISVPLLIWFDRSDGDSPEHEGPSTMEQIEEWAMHIVERMLHHNRSFDWLAPDVTILVTMKWAGLGGMYIALLYATEAIEKFFQTKIRVELFSSTDNEPRC